MRFRIATILAAVLCSAAGYAEPAGIVTGRVLDQTGAPLPGVTVDLVTTTRELTSLTDDRGTYRFEGVPLGPAELTCRLLNFTVQRRSVKVISSTPVAADVVLTLALSADVVVTGASTFRNVADVENPAAEPRRHRRGGEPGGDHGGTARRPSDHARRRSARNRARTDRQPAQRRGQGQPVLPARLQPRSRHRLRHDGRRRAGQHADGRARARLRGRQLPDPGTGQRRAVQEGSVLRRRGRLLRRRRGEHQLRQSPRASGRPRWAAGATAGAVCSAPLRRGLAAAICLARSN